MATSENSYFEVSNYEEIMEHPAPHIRASALIKFNLPPTKWVVPGLIPQGVTVFAGAPKSGKSTLMLDISLSITTGQKALGNIDVDRGTVIYYALEYHLTDIITDLDIMLQGEPVPNDLVFVPRCLDLKSGGKASIKHDLKQYRNLRMIVIDTMGLMRGPVSAKDEHSYSVNQEAMRYWSDLSKTHGASFVLVHHNRKLKGKEDSPDPLDRVLGSQAIIGGADTIMTMLPKNGTSTKRKIYRSSRSPLIEPSEFNLEFDVETHRSKIVDATEMEKSTKEREEITLAMWEFHLVDNKYSVGPNDVAKKLGKKDSNSTRRLMPKMVATGDLTRVGYGQYRLAELDKVSNSS